MNATSDLVVSKELLNQLHLAPEEALIELATHLYATRLATMGQAKKLANLDQISFQRELKKRDIYLHITIEDVRQDVETLRNLGK